MEGDSVGEKTIMDSTADSFDDGGVQL